MTTWPATLPAPAINTYKESPPNNTRRTSMDKGPAKARRYTSANTRPVTFSMKLTPEQVVTLDEFYELVGGFVEFDFVSPRTGDTLSARFVENPNYSDQDGVLYNCSVSLEILP